jgi:hypothetical protein
MYNRQREESVEVGKLTANNADQSAQHDAPDLKQNILNRVAGLFWGTPSN